MQIKECENCNNSYDNFFPGCKCQFEYVKCQKCSEHFQPELCNNSCPYCVDRNDVLLNIYSGDLSVLYKAISDGELDYYDQPASLDYRFPFGRSAISIAIVHENTANLLELLEKGADPNIFDNCGFSPLFYACDLGDTEVFKLLVSYGANPHIRFYGEGWEDRWEGSKEDEKELKEFVETSCASYIKGD